jgi:molecular chaperone GrpE
MPGIDLEACPACEGFWMAHEGLARLAEALEAAPGPDRPASSPGSRISSPAPQPPTTATPRAVPAEGNGPAAASIDDTIDAAAAERIAALEREAEEWRDRCRRADEERISALEREVEEWRDRCLRAAEEADTGRVPAQRQAEAEPQVERQQATMSEAGADGALLTPAPKGDRGSLRALLAPILRRTRWAAGFSSAAERGADSQGASTNGAIDASSVQERLKALEQEAEEWRQRCFLATEDIENLRRRVQREAEAERKRTEERIISSLLPVLDNFSRALGATDGTSNLEALAEGVELIHRQLSEVLSGQGLERIEAIGRPFNPHLHEAIMLVEAQEGQEPRQVVEELQAGFRLNDRVLRPTLVKVTED